MENLKMQVDILPNYFLRDDGTYDKDAAIKLSGKIAGVCYDKESFNHLANEPEDKKMRRVDMTLGNGFMIIMLLILICRMFLKF